MRAIGDVVRTGEPQLIELTDELLRAVAADDAQLGLLRELEMALGDHRSR